MKGIGILRLFAVFMPYIFLADAKQPNIVFILADDYGFNDIGYRNSKIKTPTLDSLAHGKIEVLHVDRVYIFAKVYSMRKI